MFVVSFGLVVAERNRLSQESKQEPKPLPLTEYVRGDAIEPGLGIQDYQSIVIGVLVQLNQSIDALASGQTPAADIEQAYQALLSAPVPPVYRSLHTTLVSLAKEAAKGEQADLRVLEERRSQLYAQYPWLP